MLSFDILNSFIFGRPSPEDTLQVLKEIVEDPGTAEYVRNGLEVNDRIQEIRNLDTEKVIEARLKEIEKEYNIFSTFLPMTSLAAADSDNMCVIKCEQLLLRKIKGEGASAIDLSNLEKEYSEYFKGDGISVCNIGKLLQKIDPYIFVQRRFRQSAESIIEQLGKGYGIIAVINQNKLGNSDEFDEFEDMANHAVVVLSIEGDKVTLYNPTTGNQEDSYSITDFERAWADSRCFMACIKRLDNIDDYEPCPIDVADIELDPALTQLTEAISETAHEIWSSDRKKQGWKWGPKRKEEVLPDGSVDLRNPDLKPYNLLTSQEQDYDRKMAIDTIRLVQLLGYKLVNLNAMKRCPHCGGAIELQDQFCRHCGSGLMNEDFIHG